MAGIHCAISTRHRVIIVLTAEVIDTTSSGNSVVSGPTDERAVPVFSGDSLVARPFAGHPHHLNELPWR
jgi:hypothetical protein